MKSKFSVAVMMIVLTIGACKKGVQLDPKKEAANLIVETAVAPFVAKSTPINAVLPGY